MSGLRWGRLRATRTLIPEVVLLTETGRERVVPIRSTADLMRLVRDAMAILAERQALDEIWAAEMRGEARARACFEARIDTVQALEHGRQLASQRDDLIARGVDPAELEIPSAPEETP